MNLDKKGQEHNIGISTFTSKADDWVLKYSQLFSTKEDAMKRERGIKSKKSREYIEWLIAQN